MLDIRAGVVRRLPPLVACRGALMPAKHTGPRAYNDPAYRQAKAWLARHPVTCWHDGCDAPADTLDHVPALMHHHHVRGTQCCSLLPACKACNSRHGAADGNRQREPRTTW